MTYEYTPGSVFGDALTSFQRAASSTSDAKATLATTFRELAASARTAQATRRSPVRTELICIRRMRRVIVC